MSDLSTTATFTESYRKDCGCHEATASGPRPLIVHSRGRTFEVTWARLACDECDTPWRPTHPDTSRTEPEGE